MGPCCVGTFKELTVGGVRKIWDGKLQHPLCAYKCVLTSAGTNVFNHKFFGVAYCPIIINKTINAGMEARIAESV
jgi:hypothetical protein